MPDHPNEVVLKGLSQPEGPVALAGGGAAVVEMGGDRVCLTISDGDVTRRIPAEVGGRPTGLATDGDGCFWVAGGARGAVTRLSREGAILTTIVGDAQSPFLFPNDLAFGPDGLLYMTDSGIRPEDFISGAAIRPDFRRLAYEGGVYRIDPRKGRVVDRIAGRLRFANGIAFDAKGDLYFNETLTGAIYVLREGRTPEIFANVLRPSVDDRFCGPDGMAFGRDGTLFCAVYGQQEVAVVSGYGSPRPSLRTNGNRPTNVAFVEDRPVLLVTEVQHGCVELVSAGICGLPLHRPSFGF